MASHSSTFCSLAGPRSGSVSLVTVVGSSHSAAPLCESVMQKRFAVTHSDWIVFQVTTSQGIIPRRIHVLRSDLSEPLTGTDERERWNRAGFGVKP